MSWQWQKAWVALDFLRPPFVPNHDPWICNSTPHKSALWRLSDERRVLIVYQIYAAEPSLALVTWPIRSKQMMRHQHSEMPIHHLFIRFRSEEWPKTPLSRHMRVNRSRSDIGDLSHSHATCFLAICLSEISTFQAGSLKNSERPSPVLTCTALGKTHRDVPRRKSLATENNLQAAYRGVPHRRPQPHSSR